MGKSIDKLLEEDKEWRFFGEGNKVLNEEPLFGESKEEEEVVETEVVKEGKGRKGYLVCLMVGFVLGTGIGYTVKKYEGRLLHIVGKYEGKLLQKAEEVVKLKYVFLAKKEVADDYELPLVPIEGDGK